MRMEASPAPWKRIAAADLQFSANGTTTPRNAPLNVTSACNATNPSQIKTWSGSGPVTTLTPPVEADCRQLFAGNETEQERVLDQLKKWRNSEAMDDFYSNINECFYMREQFSADNFYISDSERSFPLAYAILFHNSPQQIVRLLRVIYRPHNVYCLHPDKKSSQKMINAFRKLASCFDNVFVPDDLVQVTYKHFSMVDAQMTCFQHLATTYRHSQWKYASILCGKELPFNTNRLLVDTLRSLRGDSIVNAHRNFSDYLLKERFGWHYKLHNGKLYKTIERKERTPFGFKIYKSINFISASREFVNFLLNNEKVQAIREFMYTALIPDEEFFATAYMLPEAPKNGPPHSDVWLVKAIFLRDHPNVKCAGKFVHTSCVFNVRDLPTLHKYGSGRLKVFYYNKYLMEYDHVVMDCMEKRIIELNKLEYERDCNNRI